MTNVKKIVKGDKFWCLGQGLQKPLYGTVIAMSSYLGKQIGLEFDEPIGHNCDGKGKDGHCLWVRTFDILTDDEYKAKLEAEALTSEVLASGDLEEIVL